MRQSILSLILAALTLTPVIARAVDVPAGKAAVVEAVLGKVKLLDGKKESTPKVGAALDFGDRLSTGNNGRISLRHADNAVTRLAPNTELTLKAPGEKKGVFLSLAKGVIRFLVGKRAPGEIFEVQTNNAVAAVKGTDAEVGTDGEKTDSTVYGSDREKALELLDTVGGKTIFLSPGETAGLSSEGFERRTLNKDDFAASRGRYEGLPVPIVEGAEGNEDGGDEGGQGDAGDETGVDVADAISDAFAEVMDDLGLDNFLERDDRTGDLVAGRIAYDRQGTRTQISSYIIRTDADTLLKATYSKRETGQFKGTTFAEEETVYNTALPENWSTAAKLALDDPANLDVNGYPIFWRTSQYFVAGNPQGDLMEVLREYQDPLYYAVYNGVTGYYDRGSIIEKQGFSQGLYLNDTPVHYFDWTSDESYYNYDINNATLIADYPYSYDSWETNYSDNYDEGTGVTTRVTFDYNIYYGEPAFLSTDIHMLDSEGNLQDIYAISPSGNSSYLRDFRGVDNAYNIELTFRSSYLSAPIDLLVIPEVFDNMDFYDVPEYYGGGGD